MVAINLPASGLSDLRIVLEVLGNKKNLETAIKQLDDAAAQSNAAADEYMANTKASADALMEEAKIIRNEVETTSKRMRIEADELFKAREAAVRQGELDLERARSEFNAECASTRKELEIARSDARVAENAANDTVTQHTKLCESLNQKIAQYNSSNAKLDQMLKNVKVA